MIWYTIHLLTHVFQTSCQNEFNAIHSWLNSSLLKIDVPPNIIQNKNYFFLLCRIQFVCSNFLIFFVKLYTYSFCDIILQFWDVKLLGNSDPNHVISFPVYFILHKCCKQSLPHPICHTPIFDPNYRWHVSVGPTFVCGLIWQYLTFSTKFRQRGILKYLIFDSGSDPLHSLFYFILTLNSIFYLINTN